MSALLHDYRFWLTLVSLLVLLLERLRPFRREQPLLRPLLLQDVAWLAINGYLLGYVLGPLLKGIGGGLDASLALAFGPSLATLGLLSDDPVWAQILLALLAADLLEWGVHNLLHRSAWLWRLHRVHHSIRTMDWIGNFRFHPAEVLIYQTVKHLPMALLGASPMALLVASVIATTIGHLNHANLDLSWGPLRYVLNSPRMHLWHHEAELRGRAGVNFGVVFSLWDWIFGTAYMPMERVPERLGFEDDERLPASFLWRLLLPFLDRPPREGSSAD